MAGFSNRPPSVCALSPQELSHGTVEVDKIYNYIPANALIVAENELIFLAIASTLKELKKVLIRGVGYVCFGRINCRIVFLLKPRGPDAVKQSIHTLKPNASVFLGLCKSLQFRSNDSQGRSFEVGDVIVAEAVLRKSSRYGKLETQACSEYLINVFEHGKFGWTPPKYRKQTVHVGRVLQMGDVTKNEKGIAVAEKTTNLDVAECCKGLDKEWISIVGVVTTQRFPSNASWEQYVATTMSSFVNKVLQDDQVFTLLGGGALEPRQHSPPLGNPLQETFSVKDKIEQGLHLSDCDLTQDEVQRRAEIYWEQVKEAFHEGQFHLPQRREHSEISLQNELRITSFNKIPVENSDADKIASKKPVRDTRNGAPQLAASTRKQQFFETGSQHHFGEPQRLTLPPLPSLNNTGKSESKTAPIKRKMSGHAQSSCPTLTSSMTVTMQTALLPLGTTLQSQGNCFEIIRIKSEERATVSRQGGVLPPINREKNKL